MITVSIIGITTTVDLVSYVYRAFQFGFFKITYHKISLHSLIVTKRRGYTYVWNEITQNNLALEWPKFFNLSSSAICSPECYIYLFVYIFIYFLIFLPQSQASSDKPANPFWTLKMDILRSLLQFGTSLVGLASSSSSAASTT